MFTYIGHIGHKTKIDDGKLGSPKMAFIPDYNISQDVRVHKGPTGQLRLPLGLLWLFKDLMSSYITPSLREISVRSHGFPRQNKW